MSGETVVRPVATSERIVVLDVLRGFAIFGILAVNMVAFSSAEHLPGYVGPPRGLVDQAARGLIVLLAEGKFYPLFSLLFGLGVALQLERAEVRGTRFGPLYLRRLLVLLLIGVAHSVLLWDGDILMLYAVLGALLLAFRRRAPGTILLWAGLSQLLSLAVIVAAAGPAPSGLESVATAQEALYATGSYADLVGQRASELLGAFVFGSAFMAPSVFAMFLFGQYLGRLHVFEEPARYLPVIRRLLPWALAVGLVGNLVVLLTYEPTAESLVGAVAFTIGAPTLCLSYVGAILLLVQRDAWRGRLAPPLAAVGRMALSNYLLQSLVATTIFYGYGLGLFGRVGPALGLALTTLIYLAQIALSGWWMRRFRLGPAEWLWRSLTYGRLQPMRVRSRV